MSAPKSKGHPKDSAANHAATMPIALLDLPANASNASNSVCLLFTAPEKDVIWRDSLENATKSGCVVQVSSVFTSQGQVALVGSDVDPENVAVRRDLSAKKSSGPTTSEKSTSVCAHSENEDDNSKKLANDAANDDLVSKQPCASKLATNQRCATKSAALATIVREVYNATPYQDAAKKSVSTCPDKSRLQGHTSSVAENKPAAPV
jgi:hypothetical protein